MNTQRLDGEELAIAAARALGWIPDGDQWHDEDGTWMADEYGPNERQMLAHLCRTGTVKLRVVDGACDASHRDYSGRRHSIYACGVDFTGALRRLVVAVAAREAADGK